MEEEPGKADLLWQSRGVNPTVSTVYIGRALDSSPKCPNNLLLIVLAIHLIFLTGFLTASEFVELTRYQIQGISPLIFTFLVLELQAFVTTSYWFVGSEETELLSSSIYSEYFTESPLHPNVVVLV